MDVLKALTLRDPGKKPAFAGDELVRVEVGES
jgi:hypothetical protein